MTPRRIAGEGGVFALYQGLYPLSIFQNTDTNHINLNVSQKKRIPPPFLRWPLLLWVWHGSLCSGNMKLIPLIPLDARRSLVWL